jgi:hypothetical protein
MAEMPSCGSLKNLASCEGIASKLIGDFPPMPTDTDVCLRSRLDANQRDREQMCRSVLALDPHYSDVRPRHPMGGPDGGRDIEALFDGDRIAYGAVGFHNGANDSDEQKRRIRAKFSSDLASALNAKPDLKVFAFLTNLHFTMGDQSEMKEEARRAGMEHCDVLDRERLRIELVRHTDSSSGSNTLASRFQRKSRPAFLRITEIASRKSCRLDFSGSNARSTESSS